MAREFPAVSGNFPIVSGNFLPTIYIGRNIYTRKWEGFLPPKGSGKNLPFRRREENRSSADIDSQKKTSYELGMDEKSELTALRDMRDIAFAIRDLEIQQAAVARRYRRGIKMLQKEMASCEQAIEEEDITIEGCQPWEIRTEDLKRLIANPVLTNIEEDVNV